MRLDWMELSSRRGSTGRRRKRRREMCGWAGR